jgi:octopine/nopaline transport system permease protein
MDLDLLKESFWKLGAGIPITLALAASSLTIGVCLAAVMSLCRISKNLFLNIPASAYVHSIRSTPLLVQIFLIYYGSGQFRASLEDMGIWFLFRSPWFCAILALTLHTCAYTTEILRGGILSVPWGHVEAARACGMHGFLLYRRIIFPLAIRQALPAYGNEVILMIKATALASTITIIEITGAAHQIIARTYRPVEVFFVAGAFYLSINFMVTQCMRILEVRLSPYLFVKRSRP